MKVGDRVRVTGTLYYKGRTGILLPNSGNENDFWDFNLFLEDDDEQPKQFRRLIGVDKEQVEVIPQEVYILWSYDADSWNAVPMFRSVHKTLESARSEIPLNIQQLKREPYSQYIENYTYNMISKTEVKNDVA